MQLMITDAGKELLIGCLADGDSLTFTSVAFGDGIQDDPATATALDNQVANTAITSVTEDEGHEYVTLGLTFTNSAIASGFKITEMGVFAHGDDNNSLLFAYGTEEENNADYVPANTSGLVEIVLSIVIYLGDTANITITTATSAVEAVSAALEAHIADASMHGTTLEDIGAASENHTHAASDITSGVLPVAKGGTGKGQLSAAAVLTARNGAVFELTPSKGAMYSTGTNEMPRFGILPVEGGGSGKNNHTTNAILTGNGASSVKNVPTAKGAAYAESTNGALKFGTLPVEEGGTAATTAAQARNNLGAVSKAGDAMTGNLKVSVNGPAQFRAENNNQSVGRSMIAQLDANGVAQLWNYKDGNNAQFINVNPETGDINDAVILTRRLAGTSTPYKMFGQHNVLLLAAAIQTLLQGGNITMVKSVQRGQVAEGSSGSGSITINAVDMSKTFVNLLGHSPIGNNGGGVEIWLSSATTLSYTRGSSVSSGTSGPAFSWEVVEFY